MKRCRLCGTDHDPSVYCPVRPDGTERCEYCGEAFDGRLAVGCQYCDPRRMAELE